MKNIILLKHKRGQLDPEEKCLSWLTYKNSFRKPQNWYSCIHFAFILTDLVQRTSHLILVCFTFKNKCCFAFTIHAGLWGRGSYVLFLETTHVIFSKPDWPHAIVGSLLVPVCLQWKRNTSIFVICRSLKKPQNKRIMGADETWMLAFGQWETKTSQIQSCLV